MLKNKQDSWIDKTIENKNFLGRKTVDKSTFKYGTTIPTRYYKLFLEKELSLLYEYWCFIKINSLLRKRYKLISSDFITINRAGIYI